MAITVTYKTLFKDGSLLDSDSAFQGLLDSTRVEAKKDYLIKMKAMKDILERCIADDDEDTLTISFIEKQKKQYLEQLRANLNSCFEAVKGYEAAYQGLALFFKLANPEREVGIGNINKKELLKLKTDVKDIKKLKTPRRNYFKNFNLRPIDMDIDLSEKVFTVILPGIIKDTSDADHIARIAEEYGFFAISDLPDNEKIEEAEHLFELFQGAFADFQGMSAGADPKENPANHIHRDFISIVAGYILYQENKDDTYSHVVRISPSYHLGGLLYRKDTSQDGLFSPSEGFKNYMFDGISKYSTSIEPTKFSDVVEQLRLYGVIVPANIMGAEAFSSCCTLFNGESQSPTIFGNYAHRKLKNYISHCLQAYLTTLKGEKIDDRFLWKVAREINDFFIALERVRVIERPSRIDVTRNESHDWALNIEIEGMKFPGILAVSVLRFLAEKKEDLVSVSG